jgi:hypothetical protein
MGLASTRELPTLQVEYNARKQGQSCSRKSPSPAKGDAHRNPWHPLTTMKRASADADYTSLVCEAESEFAGRAEAVVHQPPLDNDYCRTQQNRATPLRRVNAHSKFTQCYSMSLCHSIFWRFRMSLEQPSVAWIQSVPRAPR